MLFSKRENPYNNGFYLGGKSYPVKTINDTLSLHIQRERQVANAKRGAELVFQ